MTLRFDSPRVSWQTLDNENMVDLEKSETSSLNGFVSTLGTFSAGPTLSLSSPISILFDNFDSP